MPRKITQADIDRVWDTYTKVYGEDALIPTPEECRRGVPKLMRILTGKTWDGPISLGTIGLTRTVQVGEGWVLWVNRKAGWRSICLNLAIDTNAHPSLHLKMAKAVCERGWLAGALLPDPKVVAPPSREDVREDKIARLEAREAAWLKKQARAANALKKIRRSLNALRRHLSNDQ